MSNEFELLKKICELEHIAEKYNQGQEMLARIRSLQERLTTRRYRVAVIGEFKRGKSSLLNALLGAKVLPTDILPTTAVINRIRYGEEKSIIIHYKDGTHEKRGIEELKDYGTKLDAASEQMASTIREIEVIYPSVFCQNHIELLDTPGLNDNEQMSRTTLSVLGEIDSAIVVINAGAPLSQSEKNLVIQLLEQPGIHHITFVVTFIDRFDDEEDQDRLIELVRERIQKDTYQLLKSRYPDDEAILQKGSRLLESPVVFGVSSRQAMQGFTNGSKTLLEQSRFPQFKTELLAILTAGQSGDIFLEGKACAAGMLSQIGQWNEERKHFTGENIQQTTRLIELWKTYKIKSQKWIYKRLSKMSISLSVKGIPSKTGLPISLTEGKMKKEFIRQIASIRTDTLTRENILNCIYLGKTEAEAIINETTGNYCQWIEAEMRTAAEEFGKYRSSISASEELPADIFTDWCRSHWKFPKFEWVIQPVSDTDDLTEKELMPDIEAAIHKSLESFGKSILEYIDSWKLVLFNLNRQDIENGPDLAAEAEKITLWKHQLEIFDHEAEEDLQRVTEALEGM